MIFKQNFVLLRNNFVTQTCQSKFVLCQFRLFVLLLEAPEEAPSPLNFHLLLEGNYCYGLVIKISGVKSLTVLDGLGIGGKSVIFTLLLLEMCCLINLVH